MLFKAKFLFSIFVSAAVYVWIGGWWFGIGLVVLLFVHEMGHVLEAKRQGLPVSAPFFIPFLGAAIQMKRMPQSAWHEALNGIAGPILGTAGAAVIWAIGAYFDSRPLVALAFLGFLINLFNLVPFLPLDGGRIAVAIHPWIVALGLVALIGLVIVQPNPILILILILGGMETWRRLADARPPGVAGVLPRQAVAAHHDRPPLLRAGGLSRDRDGPSRTSRATSSAETGSILDTEQVDPPDAVDRDRGGVPRRVRARSTGSTGPR